jgi:HEPN domain-containing protein
MMKQMTTHRLLALLAVFALPACGESTVEPLDASLTVDEALELALLEDPGSRDIVVELTDATHDVATDFGDPGAVEGRDLSAQAREGFLRAHESARAGDHRRALDEARLARRLAARALVATGGAEAVEALIERIEELVLSLDDEDDDVFDDPELMKERLERIAAQARELHEQGHLVAAAERALLAEQVVRYHRGRRDHRGDVRPDRARLAVALAGTAVALAERLVDAEDTPVPATATDVRERQNRWLAHAKRMLALAEEALVSGRYARAVHFAHHAHWSALKAVILPGGITEDELRAMAELAHRLFEEARVALGDDPTELEERLLALAGRLIERGEQKLEEGHVRGVAPLWRGAVISRWLIG